ncbi:MAG: dephospho-CoA kinase [Gemmatimonadota bacterium]|nr:dephospho-CoA kinase [Gemmatimonadota bacterium]
MLLVGLTGNIASGKSEVARLLGERGATLIDADVLAREAVKPGTKALDRIVTSWGVEVLAPDGTLDRGALRRIAFSDQGQLEQLNAIVHPEVTRLRDLEIASAKSRGDKVVICVIPLLFERNLVKDFDYIVLVDAPRDIRLERLASERGLNETDAMNMIASQMPADLKRARADYCIENVSSIADLEQQVDKLWATLNKKAMGARRTAGVS